MLINMRNAMMMAGGKLSAKSYVQDGLVAMWDGIENAGWGVHDSNATVWKNLGSLGSAYDATRNAGTFSEDGAVFVRSSGRSQVFSIPGYLLRDKMKGEWTYEVVFTPDDGWFQTYSGIWGNHDESGKCLSGGQYIGSQFEFIIYKPAIKLWTPQSSFFAAGEKYAVSQVASAIAGTGVTYCNNSEVASLSSINPTLNTYTNAGKTMIGAAYLNGNDRVFDGIVHALRIYNRPLFAAELAANYAVDKARFGLPDAT